MKLTKFRTMRSRVFVFLVIGSVCFASCKPDTKKDAAADTTSSSSSTPNIKSAKNLAGIKVGYVAPSLNAPFYVALEKGVKSSVESYGMTYLSADGQDDISKQIAACEDLMAKGINVLILNPLDREALVPITNAATKAGIAVFTVDSGENPDANYVSAIFSSNFQNGVKIGEWVANNNVGKAMKIAIISGVKGNPVGLLKRQGFIASVAETQFLKSGNADVNVVAQGWGNWSNSGGLKAMEDILVAHPDVNVMWAEN